jgi:hypothetical protein
MCDLVAQKADEVGLLKAATGCRTPEPSADFTIIVIKSPISAIFRDFFTSS